MFLNQFDDCLRISPINHNGEYILDQSVRFVEVDWEQYFWRPEVSRSHSNQRIPVDSLSAGIQRSRDEAQCVQTYSNHFQTLTFGHGTPNISGCVRRQTIFTAQRTKRNARSTFCEPLPQIQFDQSIVLFDCIHPSTTEIDASQTIACQIEYFQKDIFLHVTRVLEP